MNFINKKLYSLSKDIAEYYKNDIKNTDDRTLQIIAEGAYMNYNGINHSIDEIKTGSKPYFDYLKYGNQYQEEVKEEPIMIENNNYETPYSFEYEPYFSNDNTYNIAFDHEVDTSDSIQMIEEMYNEPITVEENIDSDEIIDVLSFLSNKVKEVKKHIIHYIGNYRPIMNQYTDTIEAVLIE